ncbi:hypothetical protein AB0M11_05210 [Streptomyces sp. NPDC051987]|uniref:hypothetical protein n=1 Tax=Streptomyces sp. NPDC051987 TaxID=3155808 RepID=UPI003416EB20
MTGRVCLRPDPSAWGGDAIELAYPEQTPIATCHWRWVANVLAMRGHPGYWERLGLAWGARWAGGEVLFGSMTWPDVLARATGIVVAIRTFSTASEARSAECALAARDVPVIVEVDGFHLPGTAAGGGCSTGLYPASESPTDHVVKAVLVARRGGGTVRVFDEGQAVDLTLGEYEQARSAPCQGRAEPFKLYALMRGPRADVSPERLLDLVRQHLGDSHPASQRALTAYIRRARETEGRIDVCRVAGERYQAARLFEYLADEGISAARLPASLFTELTEAWYTLHVLAMHERAALPRQRRRLVRLLEQLADKESAAAEAVLA